MRWLRLVSVTCAVSMLLSACALRPRYQDLTELSPGEGPITVAVVDADSGAPLANVPVTIGEGQGRVKLQTDEQGKVTVPRDDRMKSTNALIVVEKPKGVMSYRFEPVASAPAAATPPAVTEEPPAPQPAPLSIPDGGVGPGQPPGKNTPSHQDAPLPADAGTSAQ